MRRWSAFRRPGVVVKRLSTELPDAYDGSRTGFRPRLSVHDELTRLARPTLLVRLAATDSPAVGSANVANLALARVLGASASSPSERRSCGAHPHRTPAAHRKHVCWRSPAAPWSARRLARRDLLVAFTSRFTPRAGNRDRRDRARVHLRASFVTGPAVRSAAGAHAAIFGRRGATHARHRTAGGRRSARATRSSGAVASRSCSWSSPGCSYDRESASAGRRGVPRRSRADDAIDLDFVKYDDATARRAFFRSVLERSQREPGLQAAALGFTVPAGRAQTDSHAAPRRGRPAPTARRRRPEIRLAAYLPDHRMALLSGRLFSEPDSEQAPPAAVVTCRWPGTTSPTLIPSERVSLDGGRTWVSVVGVVNDVHQYGLRANRPTRCTAVSREPGR